jgi:hypothetical protein
MNVELAAVVVKHLADADAVPRSQNGLTVERV